MRRHHPKNERIKRKYLLHLSEAKGRTQSTIVQIAAHIADFDAFTRYRDFARFHIEPARRYKADLIGRLNPRTGKPLAKSTVNSRLRALRAFHVWLADQAGYRHTVRHADADYFNDTSNDQRIARARRPKQVATLEQVLHVIRSMPSDTEIEHRNRAVVAFALVSGARDDAIASMRVGLVDIDARTINQDARYVRTKRRKTNVGPFLPVAGQYFTPRPVIEAIVKCVDPKIGETVCDPACGTGGFLLAGYEHMKTQTQDREKLRALRHTAFTGVDIVDEVVRLCAMNLYLHGIGNGGSPVMQGDALANDGGDRFKIVLTNPPFGRKSSYKVVGEDGTISTERENYEREDFKFTTSNKQFNFLQHITTILEANGRAGVVLPDNVLFEAGRVGEGIRKRLLEGFNFHTLLRLPTGIWYSPGVKANVLFFDKRPASREVQTKELWVYDYRTNVHKTLKTKRLTSGDFDDFIRCYRERRETDRFRRFSYEELARRDKLNLDIFWLKDDSLEDIDSLPEPEVLAAEIVGNLEAALEQFRGITQELAGEPE